MLHSPWLLKMLEKSGATPRERVLALFDILQDWTTAPGLRLDSSGAGLSDPTEALVDYLTEQMTILRLAEPGVLAQQVYFIAMGALQATRGGENSNAFIHGRHAVAILLDAQRPPRRLKTGMAVVSASIFLLASAMFFGPGIKSVPSDTMTAFSTKIDNDMLLSIHASVSSSPDQVASLHDSLERIRRGVCQYPQALMLAPEARAVFLENVVNGSVPANAHQMREARQLMQKVECYYPPVAMTAL